MLADRHALLTASDCIGQAAASAVAKMNNGDILLLENTRFHKGEEKNDPEFTKALAANGDIYVNDAFSAAHRAHSSTEGLAHHLPAYAGRTMQAELEALEKGLGNPIRPVVAIVGGAKVSTKIDLLMNLVKKVDALVIGGGMLPTTLSTAASPQPLKAVKLDLPALYRNSPVSCLGILLVGIANGAYGTLGAVFGAGAGLSDTSIAVMMSTTIFAGAVMQLPAGRLSDRIDRRYVLAAMRMPATGAHFGLVLVRRELGQLAQERHHADDRAQQQTVEVGRVLAIRHARHGRAVRRRRLDRCRRAYRRAENVRRSRPAGHRAECCGSRRQSRR